MCDDGAIVKRLLLPEGLAYDQVTTEQKDGPLPKQLLPKRGLATKAQGRIYDNVLAAANDP